MSNWEIAKAALGLRGEKGMAKCPVHNDGVQSLSCKRVDDDILLHCFAGCDFRDIRDALGLERQRKPAKSLDAVGQTNAKRIVAEYVYRDTCGNVLAIKRRWFPKTFDWLAPDPLEAGRMRQGLGKDGQTQLPLYRLPEAVDMALLGAPVLVVEGEKDVDTLHGLGFAAVCNPEGGNGSEKPHMSGRFSEFPADSMFVVVPDNDGPGEKHAQGMLQVLSAVGQTFLLRLPDLPLKGDVTDWVELQRKAGKTDDEVAEALLYLVAHALPWADAVGQTFKGDEMEAFEERAGIVQFQGGAARADAEAAAAVCVERLRKARAAMSPALRLYLEAETAEDRELASLLL